jgi:hypothetical protein
VLAPGRLAIVVTLVVAAVLGAVASGAIFRAAKRRVALAEELGQRLPPLPGRPLGPWKPAFDDDEARASTCLDVPGADAASGASRVGDALEALGFRVRGTGPDPRTGAIGFEARGLGYVLRGVARPGAQPDCVAARGQVAVTLDAVRGPP